MNNKLMMCTVLVVAASAMYRWQSTPSVACEPSDAFDRVWLDHVPTSDQDTVNAFAALRDQPIGVFDASSAWHGSFESFQYQYSKNELRAVFPQAGDRETITVRTRRCTVALCDNHADYCLEIDGGSRGVKKYYSRKGWEIKHASDLPSLKLRIAEVLRSNTPR